VRDRSSATYFTPEKMHVLDHKGKHFTVRGPLNSARPIQGYPVLAQAGASETGKNFCAQVAELVFSPLLGSAKYVKLRPPASRTISWRTVWATD
jgi:alkanesulfonate monooxygenase